MLWRDYFDFLDFNKGLLRGCLGYIFPGCGPRYFVGWVPSGACFVGFVRRIEEHHGEWRSLVAHPAGGRAVAGSNPVSPI